MRYPKYLVNTFAIIGVVSFIFFACSAAEDEMDNEVQIENNEVQSVQNSYGKYQVSAVYNGKFLFKVVLNTEIGVSKTYYFDNGVWVEGDNAEMTYTH